MRLRLWRFAKQMNWHFSGHLMGPVAI